MIVPALFLVAALAPGAPPEARCLAGGVPAQLQEAQRLGPVERDLPMERMILVLSPNDPDGLSRFLDDQQDPSSPLFHRWLTPKEFGQRFGASREEVSRLTSWLEGEGFVVEGASSGGWALSFSGTAAQVETAFATRLEEVVVDGRLHRTNVVPPTLPVALSGAVVGLLSLNDFGRRPLVREPLTTTNGIHSLAPADFNTIYGVDTLAAEGLDGAGQKIAVIGQTSLTVDDSRRFRQYFGLPANDPVILVNGADPGTSSADRVESNLDVQWSGAAAPAASILFVTSKTTATAFGVDLSVLYAVDQNVAGVITYSYGACEQDFNEADRTFYRNAWAQAAAQGISALVASGDSGAAGCESASASTGTKLAVNGLGSTPWNTSVGGTQFDDGGTPSRYWSDTNDPVTKKSVKGFIPEAAWNESRFNGGFGLLSTGGGRSVFYRKPLWQTGPGVPTEDQRALPDVSVNASRRNPYQFFDSTSLQSGYSGTSFSAPALAGIVALLHQRWGERQGNLNPGLFELGRTRPDAFHDVTAGSNTVTGVTGFDALAGFDMATGLGSVDATALVNAWAPTDPGATDLALVAAPGLVSIAPGGTVALQVRLATSGRDANGTLAFETLPSGFSASFAPVTSASQGLVTASYPSTVSLTAASTASPGSYTLTLVATVGRQTRRVSVTVSVGGAPSAPAGVEVQVPVVLDVYGVGGAHFRSDLVAVNRSASEVTALLRFVAAPGASTAEGLAFVRSLGAGRQLTMRDVIAEIRLMGQGFAPEPAAVLGTLFVRLVGFSDPLLVYAGSRAATPNPNLSVGGSFGTFFSATPVGGGSESAVVNGLRQNDAFRSNLALVHSPALAGEPGPLALEVIVFDGESARSVSLGAITLQPGEFRQVNGVLSSAGFTQGYATVTRTKGTDRFIAYGVVNDGGLAGGGTSDGSFVASGATAGLVPVVVDVPGATRYRTELLLTNSSTRTADVELRYTPSGQLGSTAGAGTVSTPLGPGRQLVVTDAVAFLRSLGLAIPDDGSAKGGTVLVSGASAQARTYSPNPDKSVGGTFGVSYPAVPPEAQAKTTAWIFGLRQDADARSNLAVADGRVGELGAVDYAVDLYDGERGGEPVDRFTFALKGGEWTQLTTVLARSGVKNGYARVRALSTSSFVAYGIVNDGPTPGSRTSDGSYLPMFIAP